MSADALLEARIEPGPGGGLRVRAPKIGWWSDPPERGALVGPGSSIGSLTVLNRRYRLVLPQGIAGHVEDGVTRHRVQAVEHGEILFTVQPISAHAAAPVRAAGSAGKGSPAGSGLPRGARAIVAPTDGVFYRRPSPEAEPFVREGQRVSRGQPVGLVEVMKTFNEIVYDIPGGAEEVEVLEVRGAEAREVRAGEILVVVSDVGPA